MAKAKSAQIETLAPLNLRRAAMGSVWWDAIISYERDLLARQLSKFTIRNYLNDLAPLFEYMHENKLTSLDKIERSSLRAYMAWVHKIGYAKSSMARMLSTLRSFYRFLRENRYVRNDHTNNISPVRRDRNLPSVVSVEEMERLMNAIDTSSPYGIRDRALLETIYASGIRVSEVNGLDLDDVNLPAREMKVLGKGSKYRLVLIGHTAADWINRYISEVRPEWHPRMNENAVFLNRRGSRLSVRSIQSIVKRYALAAGLDYNTHTHTLRHSFATHMLAGGAELRAVQELLGHANANSTQLYTHISLTEARRAYINAHPRAR